MSDYHSLGSHNRLGSFELHGVSNTFGNQGFAGLGQAATSDATAGDTWGLVARPVRLERTTLSSAREHEPMEDHLDSE